MNFFRARYQAKTVDLTEQFAYYKLVTKKIYHILVQKKIFLLLLLLYFISRLIFLTKLPIFNDEAIYLDWGWREIHSPGMLYYSLYDGKAPLLMWLFGISENIFTDPLFAGRLVSVLISTGSLVGIYLTAKTLFNKKIAVIASFLYIVIPIFAFYDRQALMEGPLAATGVLACYFAIKLWTTQKRKYATWLGIILGLSFWIKASGLIFIFTYFLLSFILLWKNKDRKQTLEHMGVALGMILVINFLLLINPDFWSSFHLNTRSATNASQSVSSLLMNWLKNGITNTIICFFYLTPFVFFASIAGIFKIINEKKKIYLLFLSWTLLVLLLQTFTIGSTIQRYLVPFIPLLVILAAYFFNVLLEKQKTIGKFILAGSFFIPTMLTVSLLLSPPLYIFAMAKTNNNSDIGYIEGQTSGYGIIELKNYLESLAGNKKIFVGLASNAGNPENAMIVYFNKSDQIKAGYFDSNLFGNSLNGIDCISMPEKLYFVSREDQQVGLDRFLTKINSFKNPYSDYSIGVYELKEHCQGKSIQVNPIIQ